MLKKSEKIFVDSKDFVSTKFDCENLRSLKKTVTHFLLKKLDLWTREIVVLKYPF